jgi:hypothetical protein
MYLAEHTNILHSCVALKSKHGGHEHVESKFLCFSQFFSPVLRGFGPKFYARNMVTFGAKRNPFLWTFKHYKWFKLVAELSNFKIRCWQH